MTTNAEMKSTIVAALVILDYVWDDRDLYISSGTIFLCCIDIDTYHLFIAK